MSLTRRKRTCVARANRREINARRNYALVSASYVRLFSCGDGESKGADDRARCRWCSRGSDERIDKWSFDKLPDEIADGGRGEEDARTNRDKFHRKLRGRYAPSNKPATD